MAAWWGDRGIDRWKVHWKGRGKPSNRCKSLEVRGDGFCAIRTHLVKIRKLPSAFVFAFCKPVGVRYVKICLGAPRLKGELQNCQLGRSDEPLPPPSFAVHLLSVQPRVGEGLPEDLAPGRIQLHK